MDYIAEAKKRGVAAVRHELAIFTDGKDFLGYKTVLPIRLHHFEK